MKPQVWDRSFNKRDIPRYPCPCCDGKLRLEGNVSLHEPVWSRTRRAEHGVGLEFAAGWFRGVLKCENRECGQEVVFTGSAALVEDYDEDGHGYIDAVLTPTSFWPPIEFFELSAGVIPADVRDELKTAFAVAWLDPNCAANRLRVGVERVLDIFEIPTVRGKSRLTLDARIKLFEDAAEHEQKGHAETFHALRHVGNAGAHGNDVTWDYLMDAFRVYDTALEGLFGERGKALKEAKERLAEFVRRRP